LVTSHNEPPLKMAKMAWDAPICSTCCGRRCCWF
jgi:hypothetical protein